MARTDAFAGIAEFLAVAELGSFRAAAARLRVTPAAVSQAVRALETRVGTPLFLFYARRAALPQPRRARASCRGCGRRWSRS